MSTPTWIAAIATVVLAIGVITAAWFARTASVALSRQLTAQQELTANLAEVLQLHARGLVQSSDERRRAQACRVFITLDRVMPVSVGPWHVTATVRNTSDQPVYDMYVIWQLGTVRMGKPDPVARLLPGDLITFERGTQADAANEPSDPAAQSDPAAVSAFLTFRDTAGVRWTVREDGTLSDVAPTSPHA
jgi:hypothetical protein